MTPEELRERIEEARARLTELDAEHRGAYIEPDSEHGQEWQRLNEQIEEDERTLSQLEARERRLVEIGAREGDDSRSTERPGEGLQTPRSGRARGEDIYDLTTVRANIAEPAQIGQELRDRALRSVERATFPHPDEDQDRARSHIERLLTFDSEEGRFARYLLATGSPTYKRAFGKYLQGVERSREEQAAMAQASSAERALSLAAAGGGYAVPYELDPTILLTSSGVVNPIRQLARVEQITVDEWRGITSAGVTANYQAEATEVADNSPTLAQPTVSTEKAQAFIQFSIEVGQDWGGLQSSMAMLLQEAKDELEAAKFVTGTGTNEPFGVLTGITAGQQVNAAAGQTFTLANLYALLAALPPRYRQRAAFVGDLGILNRVRQFDTVGSSAAIWVDSLQDEVAPRLLGKPVYEASEFPDTPATGNLFLVLGDFSRYLIVDRVGLTVEVVPHVFGANRRPTGQRGIYAYWRNGAKVIDANAFRALIGVA
jgi:HK97 family phage major capsid protein